MFQRVAFNYGWLKYTNNHYFQHEIAKSIQQRCLWFIKPDLGI
jgi:hypothetical protein